MSARSRLAIGALVASPLFGGLTAGVIVGAGLIPLAVFTGYPFQKFVSNTPMTFTPLLLLMVFLMPVWLGGVLGVGLGIPLMLVIGVPVHRQFRSLGWTRGWAYLLSGTLVGLPIGITSDSWFGPSLATGESLSVLTVSFVLGGAFTGGFFWLLRRPDRESSQQPEPAIA